MRKSEAEMTTSASSSANSKNATVASVDSIRSIGESIGVSNLSDEACRDLVQDLTFTVKSLLNDSKKFIRNSKRKKLLVTDIDYALKFRMIEVSAQVLSIYSRVNQKKTFPINFQNLNFKI
jgi:histone H3/H4